VSTTPKLGIFSIRGFLWETPSSGFNLAPIGTGNFDLASAFSHAVAALGIGACSYGPDMPKRVWVIGALCSVIPDIDVLGFRFGIRYGDFWGHRGFTHALLFAAVMASAVILIGFRRAAPDLSRHSMWVYFFVAAASHGFLDAMTDGGLGVAFFSPFDNPLFSSLEADSRITDRYRAFFLVSRNRCAAE
jgi:membrane-bound metal-dependent hydrolase YbcI (DUF457 family)